MYKKLDNIEEIKKVKYELDKYNYHVIEIEKINDKLKLIDHKLLGLPKGIKSDPGGKCNSNDVKIALTRKKDILIKERDMHYIHIQLCDSIIDSCIGILMHHHMRTLSRFDAFLAQKLPILVILILMIRSYPPPLCTYIKLNFTSFTPDFIIIVSKL